jgi:hypothetical protein
MPKTLSQWTVLPHGELHEIDDGILTVTGDIPMPLGNFPRRMTVVRLSGDRTAIFSAIAQPEPAMARIEALGKPSVLVVPNPGHRLDAKIWKDRYPDIRVLAPPGARDAVMEVVPVDATSDILDDPDSDFVIVPGTLDRESAMVVRRTRRTTVITNDIIGNTQHVRGIGAKIMARLLRWGVSGPSVPLTARFFVKDRAALAVQLREWAALPDLRRVIVSHGDPIDADPADTLRRLADDYAS